MMSERAITKFEERPAVSIGVPALDEIHGLIAIADRIAKTEFVPASLRGKPDAVLACVLSGREMGIGPMQSLAQIAIIDGRPAPSPELMRCQVLKSGHSFEIEAHDEKSVTVSGLRRGLPEEKRHRVTWTMQDATRAGLANKTNWKTYPRAMLLARATAELCRAIFPDVISGMSYTPEELESLAADAPAPVVTVIPDRAEAIPRQAGTIEEKCAAGEKSLRRAMEREGFAAGQVDAALGILQTIDNGDDLFSALGRAVKAVRASDLVPTMGDEMLAASLCEFVPAVPALAEGEVPDDGE